MTYGGTAKEPRPDRGIELSIITQFVWLQISDLCKLYLYAELTGLCNFPDYRSHALVSIFLYLYTSVARAWHATRILK